MDRDRWLLVHPPGTSGLKLEGLARELQPDVEVLAPDRPGWGAESALAPTPGVPYYAAHGAWLAARLRESSRPRRLFGWSSGGFVALHAALLAPEHVLSLHLYEPPLGSSRDHDDRQRLLEFARVLTWSLLRRPRRARAAFWRMVSARRDGATGFERSDRATADALLREPGPLTRELLAGTGEELLGQLGRLRVPVQGIVGAESTPAAQRALHRLCAEVPGAEQIVLAGCDHLAPLVDPRALAQALNPLSTLNT